MLDINLFRVEKGGNPDIVRESQRRRGARVEAVDEVIALDKAWVAARFNADAANKQINAVQKEIGALMKAKNKDATTPLLARKAELAVDKERLEVVVREAEALLNRTLSGLGNLVHSSVPTAFDEKDNRVDTLWWPEGRTEAAERERRLALIGKDGKGVKGLMSHHEVLAGINGYDPVRGANIAGHRGYFLTDAGVDFNLALITYGLNFLSSRGYTKLWTPFFMKKEVMAKTAQLEQFDEELYKVVEKESDGAAADDENSKYLIATSEQPISAFHAGEWFVDIENELPRKYAGLSTCFRKEAGAHGKDTWGIFRVHQFEKVEQFVLTDPEKSWEMHDEMLKASEDFYKSLNLPYRVISIVSGALNNAAAKKYDLEAWFPFQAEYKELVSCSNCTDYQSRRLDIRCGVKKNTFENQKKYVHCLNSTLCATERTICCILENYQTAEGVVVPEVLRPYMGGKEFIPFAVPKETKKSLQASASKTTSETDLAAKLDGIQM